MSENEKKETMELARTSSETLIDNDLYGSEMTLRN